MTAEVYLLPEDALVIAALRELDATLPPLAKGEPQFILNVVGGYALIVRNIRTDRNQLTDIDYAGAKLPVAWRHIVDEIGAKYNLGRGWINNDLVLSDTGLEDLQLSTGLLEFKTFSTGLEHFQINIATEETLLRMKIIAVDTTLAAMSLGDDFTRARDLEDIALFEARSAGVVQQTLNRLNYEALLLDVEVTTRVVKMAAQGKHPVEILAYLNADRNKANIALSLKSDII